MTQKYSKRRIAEVQIFRAIKVLTENADAISAITLAGAADEILGQKLRDAGRRNAFDHEVEFGKQMWTLAAEKLKKDGRTITIPDEAALKKGVNRARNELKHKGENRPLVAIFSYEAEVMIVRALNNYVYLYGRPPPQKYVQAWYESQTL